MPVRGRFSFSLLPGRYTLIAKMSGNGPWKRSVDAVAHSETRANIVTQAI